MGTNPLLLRASTYLAHPKLRQEEILNSDESCIGEEIPLLAKEGWPRHEENVSLPIWRGRGGAKRKPDRAKPQQKFGEIFRPEHFAKLTTPSAAVSVASRLLIDAAATPPLRGGEFGHSARRQFIHTFSRPGLS